MNGALGLTDLEQQIIQLCGLSKMLAPGLLRRALADVDAGNPPTPDDVLRALPMIETRMRAYLPPSEVRERSFHMRELLKELKSAALAPAPTAPAASTAPTAPTATVERETGPRMRSMPPGSGRRDP